MSANQDANALFDSCVVSSVENRSGKAVPHVLYRFPPKMESFKSSKDDMMIEKMIPQFCFPDIHVMKPMTKYRSETFTFAMTDSSGGKRYGYCRRLLPPGKDARYPESYCILTLSPVSELFFQILDEVENFRRLSEKNVAIFSFLKAVLAHSFPQPGESFSIRVYSPETTDGVSTVNLSRADDYSDSALKYVSFVPLFRSLDVGSIVGVFLSMCIERRTLFIADSLDTLSSCVLALTSVLYPFNWQHIMIPLLPQDMVSYVCAPMPFVIGLQKSLLPHLQGLPIESDVVLIDLDTSTVAMNDCDLPLMASKYIGALTKELESIASSYDSIPPQKLSKHVSTAFLRFFVSMMVGYDKCFKTRKSKTSSSGKEVVFDSSAFRKAAKSDRKAFVGAFSEGQMFEQFVFGKERVLSASLGSKKSSSSSLFVECDSFTLFEKALKDPSCLDGGTAFQLASEGGNSSNDSVFETGNVSSLSNVFDSNANNNQVRNGTKRSSSSSSSAHSAHSAPPPVHKKRPSSMSLPRPINDQPSIASTQLKSGGSFFANASRGGTAVASLPRPVQPASSGGGGGGGGGDLHNVKKLSSSFVGVTSTSSLRSLETTQANVISSKPMPPATHVVRPTTNASPSNHGILHGGVQASAQTLLANLNTSSSTPPPPLVQPRSSSLSASSAVSSPQPQSVAAKRALFQS